MEELCYLSADGLIVSSTSFLDVADGVGESARLLDLTLTIKPALLPPIPYVLDGGIHCIDLSES
jgi:hypothetical protein